MTVVRYSTVLQASPQELFDFHRDVRNLPAVSPPIPRVTLLSEAKVTEAGDLQRLRLALGPFGLEWVAQITRVEEPRLLEDRQVRGPFRAWRHRHRFSACGSGARLEDVVAFRLLPTPAGEFLEWLLVAPGLRLQFWWRHRQTGRLLGRSREGSLTADPGDS